MDCTSSAISIPLARVCVIPELLPSTIQAGSGAAPTPGDKPAADEQHYRHRNEQAEQ
ncbi:MAG: hypothetical protein MI924_11515 [Chloroflexales bacterium]|nr:hypothetical protein [Chloroflexales bacterium]